MTLKSGREERAVSAGNIGNLRAVYLFRLDRFILQIYLFKLLIYLFVYLLFLCSLLGFRRIIILVVKILRQISVCNLPCFDNSECYVFWLCLALQLSFYEFKRDSFL